MTVRAKFRLNEVTPHEWGTELLFTPVYSENPQSENRAFWDATPNGSLRMVVKNKAAADYFEPNGEYYLDFTQAVAG